MVAVARHFTKMAPTWRGSLVVLLSEKNPSSLLDEMSANELTRLDAGRALGALGKILRLLRTEKPAVIVSSLPHVSAVVALAKVFANCNALHVVRLESSLTSARKHDVTGWLRQKFFRWLLTQADHFIAVSKELKDASARTMKIGHDRLTFIPNPLVVTLPEGGPQDPSEEKEAEIRLVAVGRLAKEKNFRLAIEAVRKLRDLTNRSISLQIFGEGPLRGELQVDISRAGLSECVFLRGFVQDKRIIYGAGDILIMTSFFEGFPLNVIEAIGYGLRVVSVDCDFGPREIITASWLGLLASYDPEDFASKILSLVETPTVFGDLEKRRDYIRRNFNVDSIASRHESLFKALLLGQQEVVGR